LPIVIIHTWEGKTVDQKRRISEAITKALVDIGGVRREAVEIVFCDVQKTNWAKGGVLAIDLPEKK
jgi:4-oxalocrotonate tautomerase